MVPACGRGPPHPALSRLLADSCQNQLWATPYMINGGCSDDGFDYFRGRLIVQGRDPFEQALANPGALPAPHRASRRNRTMRTRMRGRTHHRLAGSTDHHRIGNTQ
ncbi:DUF4240 domain-containing protein [Streptomyces sp. A30]|uniref:DUF4240 domain-containing protein n=1 Tax=Streptomyces sp. A30 TaxID=2789273 RepID=UPI003980C7FC